MERKSSPANEGYNSDYSLQGLTEKWHHTGFQNLGLGLPLGRIQQQIITSIFS